MDIKELSDLVEKVSKIYSKQHSINRDSDWFLFKVQEELGELTQSYLMYSGRARTKGKTKKEIKNEFELEVADVICHILLLSKHHKIKLEDRINEKWLSWLPENKVKR